MFIALATLTIAILLYKILSIKQEKSNVPPHVPSSIPFLGSAIEYGIDPVAFLIKCKALYGSCFTFTLFGRKLTFVLGPDGNNFVLNAKHAQANAEMAYQKLCTPVFGKGVVYDCPNEMLMQQKRMAKDALTINAFRTYVPLVRHETVQLIKEFWEQSVHSDGSIHVDLFHDMAELTIRTAAACLLGKEIRAQLHSNVAKLYGDLDAAFTPMNLFISWVPTPINIRRDRANRMMTETFKKIIDERRKMGDTANTDLLQTYMTCTYKDGSKMTDEEVAHMMIAILMAGQHTSSTTTTWMLYRMAQNPETIEMARKEMSTVLTGHPNTPWKEMPTDFDYDQLKKFTILDYCMKETLRLHPPIHTIMRKVTEEMEFSGMKIPVGHYICSAPCVSQLDPIQYEDPERFDAMRHVNGEDIGEWAMNATTLEVLQRSARSHYVPFGAGRHRCIGEQFAYMQVKTIVATILCQYDVGLPVDEKSGRSIFPARDYTSMIVLPAKNSKLVLKRRA